ncbi:MAG TPA: hypothetical protein VE078_20520, partial [Thermoanaerobaculia bacterium]|nr:hypothetical protein [Thermoanaerobaculia bacterium]
VAVAALAVGSVGPVWAQTPAPAAPAPPAAPKEEKLTEQKEGDKPKTLWDEFKLFSYIASLPLPLLRRWALSPGQ